MEIIPYRYTIQSHKDRLGEYQNHPGQGDLAVKISFEEIDPNKSGDA